MSLTLRLKEWVIGLLIGGPRLEFFEDQVPVKGILVFIKIFIYALICVFVLGTLGIYVPNLKFSKIDYQLPIFLPYFFLVNNSFWKVLDQKSPQLLQTENISGSMSAVFSWKPEVLSRKEPCEDNKPAYSALYGDVQRNTGCQEIPHVEVANNSHVPDFSKSYT